MVHKLCICIYLYLWHLVSVCICARNSIANNLPAQSAAVEMYLHSTLQRSQKEDLAQAPQEGGEDLSKARRKPTRLGHPTSLDGDQLRSTKRKGKIY